MSLGSALGKVAGVVVKKFPKVAAVLDDKLPNIITKVSKSLESGALSKVGKAAGRIFAKDGIMNGLPRKILTRGGAALGVLSVGSTVNRMNQGESLPGAVVGGVGDTVGMVGDAATGIGNAAGAAANVAKGGTGLLGDLGNIVQGIGNFVKDNPLLSLVGAAGIGSVLLGGGGIGKLALLAVAAAGVTLAASGKGGNILNSLSESFLGKSADDISASVAGGAESSTESVQNSLNAASDSVAQHNLEAASAESSMDMTPALQA